ncbi:sensitivity to high expression protein she9 [Linderina pennispora]|nr:sensitivity to high expression protein she9 [Linderina pennispora]
MFSKADKGNAGTSPASGQTSEILDRLKQRGTRDTKDLADSVSAFFKDSVLHRAVLTGRRRIEAIKALPQDDDWVTWASKALNQMTGYERIQALKEKVETCGVDFNQARHDLQAAKEGHGKMIHQRISSQREINSLLQRKHLWDETDVARFTSLYRDEHQAEILERTAGKELKEAEELVDRRYGELVGAIRERYHEEQIWSDKIRRASTYGTWAVLFMNILALFMAQAIFEPRKRRKIVAGVDEKLTAAIADQNSRIADVQQGVQQRLASHEGAINEIGQHLGALASVLAAMDQRQATEMAVISSQLLNSTHEPDEPENNETELDMYNNIKPYTREEAHKLMLGTATVASIVTALVTYYFAG